MSVMSSNKRQKVETSEFFSGINKIDYKGDGVSIDDTLCYRFYNPNERIHGRTLSEWIKPAISFTYLRSNGWDCKAIKDNFKRFVTYAFELCVKLGVKYWTAYDTDFAEDDIEEIVEYVQELQQRFNVKPLWIGADFNSKYHSETCHDAYAMMHACHQIKRCMDVAHKLGAEGFMLSTNGFGCDNMLNTDVQREIKNYSRLYKMTIDYKERSGFRGQLLMNPIDCSNDQFNSYVYDVQSGYCFLKHHNLERHYKQIVSAGFQFHLGIFYNVMGCVEISKPITTKEIVLMSKSVIEQGGLTPGGFVLQIPARKHYDAKNMFLFYIKHIDNLSRGFKIASKMISDQIFSKNIQQRYLSYYNGLGLRLSNGDVGFEDCEDQIQKHHAHADNPIPNRGEHWEIVFNNYMSSYKFN